MAMEGKHMPVHVGDVILNTCRAIEVGSYVFPLRLQSQALQASGTQSDKWSAAREFVKEVNVKR